MGLVAGQGDDVAINREQQRLADGGAVQLDFREVLMLEPFHQQQVEAALIEAGQQLAKIGLTQIGLNDAGVTAAGGHHHLAGAGLAQAVAVFARLVDVKVVVGVLEYPEAQTAAHQQRDELLEQGGLAGAAPGGKAEQGQGGGRGHEVAPCPVAESGRRAS